MHDINHRVAMISSLCIGGLAVAGWRLLVAPMHGHLATASAQTAALREQVKVLQDASLPEQAVLDQELARAREQQERLSAATVAPDGNHLRERIRELAATDEVRVDRLERRNRAAGHEGKQASYALRDVVGFSMTVRGGYSNVAQFIQDVRGSHSLTRITAVKLSSGGAASPDTVTAIIETSHYRLVSPHAKPEKQEHSDAPSKQSQPADASAPASPEDRS